MRLTLRTLLAYLDNTLEPEDAEILRAKLGESGFATQLVQRIRGTLVDASLSAPSPTAVSPVSEANMISEYLDSTLSAEQVAEIERACLESPPHLAEAAACHQILTMVLGMPADVSDELRQRIYELPDTPIAEMPTSGSFSAVAMPEPDTLTGMPELPASNEPSLQSQERSVVPVGIGDSGVSDAPTRLRESGTLDDVDATEDERVVAADLYEGSRLPAKLTPWLVSLALAGVFAFAVIKISAPLFSKPVTQANDPSQRDKLYPELADRTSPDEEIATEIEVPADEAPVMEPVGVPAVDVNATEEPALASASDIEIMPPPKAVAEALPPTPAPMSPESLAMDPITGEPIEVPASVPPTSTLPKSTSPKSVPKMATLPASIDPPAIATETMPPPAADASAADASAADASAAETDAITSDAGPEAPAMIAVDPDAPPAAKDMAADVPEPDVQLARVDGNEILLFARAKGTDWAIVAKDSVITQRPTLLNAPKFRSTLNIGDDTKVNLVDATQVRVLVPEDQEIAGLDIDFGRVLISVTEADLNTRVVLAGRTVQLSLLDKHSVAAIEVRHLRRPGFDPMVAESHMSIARVVCVAGKIDVSLDNANDSLEPGQQWMFRGSEPAKITKVLVSTWFDPQASDDSPIDSSAREGLKSLLQEDQPVALLLREAIGFRKSEVVALAAQTMLHLGNGDVYFGTDGILSQQNQRLFWKEHVGALREVVNRSVESATIVRDDIAQMESADGESLFRLLEGYSQTQLAQGGDAELIKLLESNVMSVRVLAVENLREITGTTLNFRAEEDSVARRSQSIKKWRVRRDKGDIRWSQE